VRCPAGWRNPYSPDGISTGKLATGILTPATTLWNRLGTLTSFGLIDPLAGSRPALRRWRKRLAA
jgi:hypothetical protein